MIAKFSHGFRALFFSNRLERQLDDELRFHLEMQIRENMERGMSAEKARYAALRSFGGVEQIKERCRDVRGARVIETLWQDFRYGFRMLKARPGFTFAALTVLALGIGANTAIFSMIYGVLIRPLPYRDGDRLVVIKQQAPLAGVLNMPFSVKEFDDYKLRSSTLKDLAEYHSMSFILLGRDEPERVQTGVVSANFFDVLGVKPLLGRTFAAEDAEHGAEAVLVLSYNYWQQSHGGDTGVVGRQFRMNDRVHTVIGVLPLVPQYPNQNDVYMPVSACPIRSSERFKENRQARMMSVVGRLKDGVSAEAAEAEMGAIAGQVGSEHREAYPESRGYEAKAVGLEEELTREGRPTFLILLGTAGLVLMIACANVGNLMLARMMQREREMAMRAALGAGRGRLVRQVMTESTMLSVGGGVIGLGMAWLGMDVMRGFAERFTARAGEIEIDGGVMVFTVVVSVMTGIVFGMMPVMAGGRGELAGAMKEGGRGARGGERGRRIRNGLIVGQVAVSFMLLIGAGLMMRSLFRLQQINPGFNPESVLVMRISPNWSRLTTPEHYRTLYKRLVERVQSQPGVVSTAISSTFPLNPAGTINNIFYRNFQIEGRPVDDGEIAPRADFRNVSPEYFQTIRAPLIKGRTFTEGDDERALQVGLINQSMARHRWGEEDPIGKRISLDRGQSWITIVGVVGDVKQYGLSTEPVDELYVPLAQNPGGGYLLARAAMDPMSLALSTRNAIHEVDSETAVTNVQTLEQVKSESLASPRLTTLLLGLFALVALTITASGIAGVMALSVSQRTHELGIRMALGASQGKVLGMIMRQGMGMVLAGLALGVIGALLLTRVLSALLFAVEPTDPLTYIAVSLVLAGVAGISCFVPARKVTSIDPMIALRSE